MEREYFLMKLPPFLGDEKMVVEDQRVRDIQQEIIDAHGDYAAQYDLIIEPYKNKSIPEICKALFRLCKNEFRYVIEDDNKQTVRSPGAIVALSRTIGADCKHYASFIGGILDALKRKGKNIDWFYRFASYDVSNPIPEHVFVVVNYQGREIWIDPVLDELDQRYPIYFHNEDQKPNMSLYRVSGIGNNSNATVKVVPQFVDQSADLMPFYQCGLGAASPTPTGGGSKGLDFGSLIASAIPVLLSFFGGLFGNQSMYTLGVRWLTAYYQYYVLGDASATGSTKSKDQYTPEAQAWFATVLGVPIYDRYRLHALMGTNAADGAPLNKTDLQKRNDYLALGPDTADVEVAAVDQAIQIAKQLKWAPAMGPGDWKKFSVAAPDLTNGNSNGDTKPNGDNNSGDKNGGTSEKPGFFDWVKQNPFESALIGAAVYLGVVRPIIRRRKRA